MTQQQKAPKQPQDPYAQRGKSLTSSVQRLRGWVGSDPSRTPELADALVQLAEHRLLGHGHAVAAADAQEAVRLAAQLLSATGPIGPYTSVADATRLVTAIVHLATIQLGVGRPDTAGLTIESAQDLQQQLRDVALKEQLTPRTEVWALWCNARAALASGDVAAANTYADSALARLGDSGLRNDPDAAYLAIDVDRLVSDCRWASGQAEEGLPHLHLAKDRYDEVVDGRLREPGRLSPALVERLAEPLFGLYRDLADRLVATGEVDHGLVTRRTLVELLQGLAGRLGEPTRVQLALALSDLATDLLSVDRLDEAESAAGQAAALALDRPGVGSYRLLVAEVSARALTRSGRVDEALALLRPVLSGADQSLSSAHAVGLFALADALRAAGDVDAADATAQTFDDLARDLVGPGTARLAGYAAVQDLARGVVSRGALAQTAPEVASEEVAADDVEVELQRQTAAWLKAERAEAHRLEVERLEQARVEAERREAERVAAERAAAEQLAAQREQADRAERIELERRAVAEEEERLDCKRRREERLEAHRLEVERLEAERLEAERAEAERRAAAHLEAELRELAVAQVAWEDAKARRDRRGARAANERVVELLRRAAQADVAQYGPHLRQALEELSSARLRGGDILGSRALAREAKVLSQTRER